MATCNLQVLCPFVKMVQVALAHKFHQDFLMVDASQQLVNCMASLIYLTYYNTILIIDANNSAKG